MCKAKVFLCGVAALVLVTVGLLYQARAVAQQRQRAEAERRQAEEQRAFNEQAAEARRLARQEHGLAPNLDKALAELAELRAAQLQRFLQERQKLMEQMAKLEAEERETLAKIDAKSNELQKQLKNRPAPEADKLDRILERLDRIEQRLERLERAGQKKSKK
jgi:hypothetical protein